jgi:hypothetical protein
MNPAPPVTKIRTWFESRKFLAPKRNLSQVEVKVKVHVKVKVKVKVKIEKS